MASGGYNGTIQLWNATDPALPLPLGQPQNGITSTVYTLAFSPDGQTLATGGMGGAVIWQLNVADAIKWICATTSNVLTPTQWHTYIPQLPYNPPCAH
jgi:WD40 repeat protein